MFLVKPNSRIKTRRFANFLKAVDFYSIGGTRSVYSLKQSINLNNTGRRRVKSRQAYRQCMSPLPILRTGMPYPTVITNFSASKFSKKELVSTKDAFGRIFFFPAFSLFYAGMTIMPRCA